MIIDPNEEQPRDVVTLINYAMGQGDNIPRFLKTCLVIYKANDKKTWAEETEELLSNQEFMKISNQLTSIKENNEEKMLYYGPDKGPKDELAYRETEEELMTKIEIKNLGRLGLILKELGEQKGFEL